MLLFVQIFIFNAICIALFILVHEIGHYSIGRLAGIPAGEIRIRLLTFPQQVVLRDGTEWVSVSDLKRYLKILHRHIPSIRGQLAYITSGFLFETVFTLAMGVIMRATGFKLFAMIIIGLSLIFYLVYLFVMDLPHARRQKEPWGDSTLMFEKAPVFATWWCIGMVIVRLGVIGLFLWL